MINAITFYRVSSWFYKLKIPMIPSLIKLFIFLIYNSVVPFKAKIGRRTFLVYGGVGCVIHRDVIIGTDCIIGSNVTIGGKSGVLEVPQIGDFVYISTGAKILGNVKVGNYAVIGANAVVVKDVPDNAIVVGVPAKIISYKGGPEYYKLL